MSITKSLAPDTRCLVIFSCINPPQRDFQYSTYVLLYTGGPRLYPRPRSCPGRRRLPLARSARRPPPRPRRRRPRRRLRPGPSASSPRTTATPRSTSNCSRIDLITTRALPLDRCSTISSPPPLGAFSQHPLSCTRVCCTVYYSTTYCNCRFLALEWWSHNNKHSFQAHPPFHTVCACVCVYVCVREWRTHQCVSIESEKIQRKKPLFSLLGNKRIRDICELLFSRKMKRNVRM